jgi:hypothetical protein
MDNSLPTVKKFYIVMWDGITYTELQSKDDYLSF